MSFTNKTNGYVLLDNQIKVTSDGGETWRDLRGPGQDAESGSTDLTGLFFLNDSHGWCFGSSFSTGGGTEGRIWFSKDGGLTWEEQKIEDRKGISKLKGNRWDVRDIHFINEQTGWAAGYGVVLSTKDQGASWSIVKDIPGIFTKVRFNDIHHGWLMEKDVESSLFTKNAGISWEPVRLPDAQNGGLPFLNKTNQFILLDQMGRLVLSDSSRRRFETAKIDSQKWNLYSKQGKFGSSYIHRSVDGSIVAIWRIAETGEFMSLVSVDEGKMWITENP